MTWRKPCRVLRMSALTLDLEQALDPASPPRLPERSQSKRVGPGEAPSAAFTFAAAWLTPAAPTRSLPARTTPGRTTLRTSRDQQSAREALQGKASLRPHAFPCFPPRAQPGGRGLQAPPRSPVGNLSLLRCCCGA